MSRKERRHKAKIEAVLESNVAIIIDTWNDSSQTFTHEASSLESNGFFIAEENQRTPKCANGKRSTKGKPPIYVRNHKADTNAPMSKGGRGENSRIGDRTGHKQNKESSKKTRSTPRPKLDRITKPMLPARNPYPGKNPADVSDEVASLWLHMGQPRKSRNQVLSKAATEALMQDPIFRQSMTCWMENKKTPSSRIASLSWLKMKMFLYFWKECENFSGTENCSSDVWMTKGKIHEQKTLPVPSTTNCGAGRLGRYSHTAGHSHNSCSYSTNENLRVRQLQQTANQHQHAHSLHEKSDTKCSTALVNNWQSLHLASHRSRSTISAARQNHCRGLPTKVTMADTETKWRSAVDPSSGKTYYYHIETRETQWRKPLELATPEERRATEEKERQQRDFFAAMEANILKSINDGAFCMKDEEPPSPKEELMTPGLNASGDSLDHSEEHLAESSPVLISPSKRPRPRMVRTISSMEDSLLATLVQRVPSYRNLRLSCINDQKEIIFQPRAAEASPHLNRKIPIVAGPAKEEPELVPLRNVARDRSLSLLEATTGRTAGGSSSSRSLLLETSRSSNRSSLNVIDEHCEADPGSLLSGMSSSSNNNSSDEAKFPDPDMSFCWNENGNRREMFGSQLSFGNILANLPKESRDSVRSLYGASNLDESNMNFGLTIEETNALEELAKVTEQMSKLQEEEEGKPLELASNGGLLYLTDIVEGEDDESDEMTLSSDEDDEEEETPPQRISSSKDTYNMMNNSRIMNLSKLRLDDLEDSPPQKEERRMSRRETMPSLDSPPQLMDYGGGTPLPGKQLQRPHSCSKIKLSPKKKALLEKPAMERRNTCGTLYVGSTMSSPDQDATIKCVCGVVRAHIVQSDLEEEDTDISAKYLIFNDMESQQKVTRKGYRPPVDFVVKPPPPTLDEITTFYRDVFLRAKMEPDCIIMTLIYVERLIKVTQGELRPRTCNWRSILFSCMVLSSKVWDDLSMWNADFSETCPAGIKFSLQRINELEVAVLSTLQYTVKVPASEYAKYYFLLRSMLIKSGLAGDDFKTAHPLDVEGAKRLQHLSTLYQSRAASSRDLSMPVLARRFSVGTELVAPDLCSDTKRGKVVLERVVKM